MCAQNLGSYDEATRSVRVRRKNKSAMSGKTETELRELSESAQQYIQSVIKGLDLGDGQFLLAVAWVTSDAVRYHEMFPSVLGEDVVFGTNQEKRPLMRGTGKSAENKNLPLFNAFLPSQQRWVFDWTT
jgi:hypothetical protein